MQREDGSMIVVTGANGPFGSQIVEQLLTRLPAADLAVSVRDPLAASRWEALGVSVRHGDFDQPATLPVAFAGARTILINSTNYGTPPDQRSRQVAAALQAAADARVVLTSWQDLGHYPLPAPDVEPFVPPGGTVVRINYGMAASVARDVLWARKNGTLRAPAADARITPASTADLAEATAVVLAQTGHEGRTYELSAPDAIGWADLASLAGQGVEYVPISDDEFRRICAQQNFPAAAIDALIDYYAALRSDWASTPSPDLSTLLGRPATPALQAVSQAVEAWAWG
jgi:NAD(P)H dehydrogenase (quinone)